MVKILASGFEKVQNEFESESVISFVVGVGYAVATHRFLYEIGHWNYLCFGFQGRGEPAEIGDVVVIHSYDNVEGVKIGAFDLTAYMSEFVSAMSCVNAHASVGKISDMPPAGTGRIDYPLLFAGMFVNNFAHHTFGSRTPAYVAQANEKDFYLFFVFKCVDELLSFGIIHFYFGGSGFTPD